MFHQIQQFHTMSILNVVYIYMYILCSFIFVIVTPVHVGLYQSKIVKDKRKIRKKALLRQYGNDNVSVCVRLKRPPVNVSLAASERLGDYLVQVHVMQRHREIKTMSC